MTGWELVGAVYEFYQRAAAKFKPKSRISQVFLDGTAVSPFDADVDWHLNGFVVEKANFKAGGKSYALRGRYPLFGANHLTLNGKPAPQGDIDLKMDNLNKKWRLTYRLEWTAAKQRHVVQLFTDITYADLLPYQKFIDKVGSHG